MNDELRELKARLERATARGDAGPDDADAETAALREGWLALGQILENVDAGLEPSFEKRLREAVGTGSLPENVPPTLPPTGYEPVPASSRSKRSSKGDSPVFVPPLTNASRRCPVGARKPGQSPRARLLPLLIAAAAVLLVVVTIAWRVRGIVTPERDRSGGDEIAKTSPVPKEPREPKGPKAKPAAVPSAATELAWDDSLDAEIVSAGQAVMRVQQEWHALADASTAVQYQLQQLSKELGDN